MYLQAIHLQLRNEYSLQNVSLEGSMYSVYHTVYMKFERFVNSDHVRTRHVLVDSEEVYVVAAEHLMTVCVADRLYGGGMYMDIGHVHEHVQ